MRVVRLLLYLLLIFTFSTNLQPATRGTFLSVDSTSRTGKLELDSVPVMPTEAKVQMLKGENYDDPDCCLMGMCKNCLNVAAFQGKNSKLNVEDIRDLAILAPPTELGRVLRLTEASISIVQKQRSAPPRVLFQTRLDCSGCGESVSALARERNASFQLTLDTAAAIAAQAHFRSREPGVILVIKLVTASGKLRNFQLIHKRNLRRANSEMPNPTGTLSRPQARP